MKMTDNEKVAKIKGLFDKLLLKDHDIENITCTFTSTGIACCQVRTEHTILNLGTFAAVVQDILDA